MSFVCEHSLAASALRKEATVLIKLGDLDGAIMKLKEAKKNLMQTGVGYSIDTWCRLANVLQKAGRYDDAMLEMDFLLSNIRSAVRGPHMPATIGHTISGPSESEYQFLEVRRREVLWRHRRQLQIREIKRLRRLKKKQK